MNGVLAVNKPPDFTSFDVVAKLRGMSRTKRVGHAGTLDPMATGVLPVFFGEATKVLAVLPESDKRYTAQLRLGLTTDTQDRTGRILTQCAPRVTEAEFLRAAAGFVGDILQLPPMYSAVKIGGRPLYKAARQGEEIRREPRPAAIYQLDVLRFDPERQAAVLDVRCSKGTYIRTLCADLGDALGCGAVLTELCRTEAAGFSLAECRSLPELQALADEGRLEEALLPAAGLLGGLPCLRLDAYDARLYRNGVPLELGKRRWAYREGDLAVYGPDGALLGVSAMDREAGQLRLRKLL